MDSYSQGVTVCLQTDLDLTGSGFASIPTFGGVFEGQGHTISGLSLTANRSHTGFFRYTARRRGAQLNLSGEVRPGGSAQYAEGLAGNNSGSIPTAPLPARSRPSPLRAARRRERERTALSKTAASPARSGQHYTGGVAGQNLRLHSPLRQLLHCQHHQPGGRAGRHRTSASPRWTPRPSS